MTDWARIDRPQSSSLAAVMDAENYEPDQLCLICLASTEGVGSVSINKLAAGAKAHGMSLGEALRLPEAQLERDFGIAAKAAAIMGGVQSPVLGGQAILDELLRFGARPVFEGSQDYPARLVEFLGPAAPPVLFVLGEAGILGRSSVAVVGSRRPSKAALGAARSFTATQAGADVTVVSGGAAGIDTAAHLSAISAGATAVVPPVGIGRFRWRGVAEADLRPGCWCVVGQFPVFEQWRKRSALMRNRTIVAASDAVVAFEPRDTGGTWNGCVTALRMRKPLFVVGVRSAHRRGLQRLVRHGAVVLDPNCMPDYAAFKELVDSYCLPPLSVQLPLFEPLDDVY